jgi:hypothetical protein
MANSTIALTVSGYPSGANRAGAPQWQNILGTAVISAGNYVAGGIATTWVPMTNASGKNFFPAAGYKSLKPSFALFQSISGSGYGYEWNLATNKLQIFVTGTAAGNPSEELPAGATPAGVTGDSIQFLAIFTEAA